jgi:hypothetical protein
VQAAQLESTGDKRMEEGLSMAIHFDTHGYNWKKLLREQERFIALVTPAWHRERLTQRQYAYAREIGIKIYLLIQRGTALPPHADDYTWRVFSSPEECAALIEQIAEGTL